MDKNFLPTGGIHTAIFLISVVVPTWVYIRWRQSLALSGIFSFLLYLPLVNVYFLAGGAFGFESHPFFTEAREVGWAASIVATLICCKIAQRIRRIARSS